MLSNVMARSELQSLARAKASPKKTLTVKPVLVDEMIDQGWSIQKRGKASVRLEIQKPHGQLLEDRVWTLFYRLGFATLSGDGGAQLKINSKDLNSPATQIDVVALDDDVAIAVECKSSEKLARRPQFQEELGKFSLVRETFVNSVNRQFPGPHKRTAATVMFHSNVILSDNDKARAEAANVILLDHKDLAYYEELVGHIGEAARFQFLSDVLPKRRIPGLTIRVPAIKTKMGKYNCYSFSVTPAYLLKLAFVSHRAKGKASDVDTYQRMIKKSRLKSIREYIMDDGVFPTNIVVSLEVKPDFAQIKQESENADGKVGWLELRPSYRSVWIIDGQHRLFAYAGTDQAEKAQLAVLAMEQLPPSDQAKLFIDINAEQKSVKRSLLQELYAELHWTAEDPKERLKAIVSKAVQGMNANPEAPLYERVQSADDKRDYLKCISFTTLFNYLNKPEFYLAPSRKNGPVEYGALWAEQNEATLARTMGVVNAWLGNVRDAVPAWWALGSGPGGGIAMNDGISACLQVLQSVVNHLEDGGHRLTRLADEDLVDILRPYGVAMGKHFASLSEDERKRFRDLRGVQGVTTRTRRIQKSMRDHIASFNPHGLDEFIRDEKAQTNHHAKEIIDRIEVSLQRFVLDRIKEEFGIDADQWWVSGIPTAVRKSASSRWEDDNGNRGAREYYLDLIDYRMIIQANWSIFQTSLGYGKINGKDNKTKWLVEINEARKIVAHASSGKTVSFEQLEQLRLIDEWLRIQLETLDGEANQEEPEEDDTESD